MNERIKVLRKSLNLSQQEFGERIGVKQGSVAGYESGARIPLDAIISSICREFGVSEVWLRTGEGEMFIQLSEDQQLVDILTKVELDQGDHFIHTMTAALKAYYRLDDVEKAVIKKMVKDALENLQQKNTSD